MQVILNGSVAQTEQSATLRSFLEGQGYNLDAIAILVNGDVIEKATQADRPLTEGDSVEVVSFMSGG